MQKNVRFIGCTDIVKNKKKIIYRIELFLYSEIDLSYINKTIFNVLILNFNTQARIIQK